MSGPTGKEVILKSMYIVDFKGVENKTEMSEMMISRMLDELKYYDKRKFLKHFKPEEYCFRLRLSITKEKSKKPKN